MPIVVSTRASAETRRAADELAGFLGRATGAHFAVTTGDGTRGIVVGTATEFDAGSDARSLAIRDRFDGREAFAVRSEPKRVLVLGATDLGVPHAVYAFLDALGFRWLFPAKEWEEVPHAPVLRADVHITSRPKLWVRQMSPGFGFFDAQARNDWEVWGRRNGLGASLSMLIGHAWEAIIQRNKKEFDAHPEYYALSGGKRLPTKLCVTNPAVQKLVVDYAMSVLEHSGLDVVSVEPSDGLGHCECSRCKAIGPPGAQPFYLANIVAREIRKRFPGKLVGLLAYSEHAEPPPFRLEPNIVVEITNGFIYGKHTLAQLAELWPKAVQYMGYYDYFSVYQSDTDMLPGMHGADPADLSAYMRFYAAHAAIAVTAECGNNWGPYGRGYYVASRLMWNPDADVSAILADFYSAAFHDAAPAMKSFYERFDPANEPLMSPSLLQQGYEDVLAASKAAEGDDRVQMRLDQIKEYLHYVFSRLTLNRTQSLEEQGRLALDILTEAYRTRRTYMNHWRAIWSDYSPAAAKALNEPALSRATPGPHPWEVEGAPSHVEVDSRFLRELASLPVRPTMAEPVFSKRLVRVRLDLPARPTGEKSLFMFVNTERFALSSDAGEPVQFTVQTGLIPAYINKPPAQFSIRDSADHVVAEGRIPLDYLEHTITQSVPSPGIYYLDFNGSGAGYKLLVPDRRGATFVVQKPQAQTIGRLDRFYFYVPKHTRTVGYFWSGQEHVVHGPDSTPLRKVDTKGDWVSIPVPAGMDGKVWFLQPIAMTEFKLLTVPNYVATASDALLVPEDVARADGLEIIGNGSAGVQPAVPGSGSQAAH